MRITRAGAFPRQGRTVGFPKKSITKRYLGRDKALRYKLLMLLTLAPLRTKLAEDEKYSEWYNGIKAKIYGRCGHKDEPGENRK